MNDNEIQYLNQNLRRAVMMERLKASHANDLPALFAKVDEFLSETLYNRETITPALIGKIEQGLTEIYQEYGAEFKNSIADTFVDSYHFERESIINAFPAVETAGVVAVAPKAAKLAKTALEYIESKPLLVDGVRGKFMSTLLDEFSENEAKAVSNALRAGHFEGKTVAELKRQIRGSRASGYRDGILQTSSRHAEALVRTGLQQAACDARDDFGQANSDIIEGVQILATLDSRTSNICRSLDHKVLKLSDPRRPPFHINCRSTFTFVLKPQYRGKDIKGERASMNGYTDNVSYYDWLKSQPKEFQDSVLGIKRATLFRDGGLTAKQFSDLNLNKNFEPLTLDEMRELKPLAFKKAGL